MTAIDCGTCRDLLPLAARAELRVTDATSVAAHVALCDECAAEAELVRVLAASVPAVPEGLGARVRVTVREAGHRQRTVWGARWGAGWRSAALAATVAAAVLGGKVVLDRMAAEQDDTLAWRAAPGATATPASWAVSFDPMLRDPAALEALSVEELELVLRELEP